MDDDIGSGLVCYGFCRSAALTAEYVLKDQKTILKDNLLLNPNRCHHPLITQLSVGDICIRIWTNLDMYDWNVLVYPEMPLGFQIRLG